MKQSGPRSTAPLVLKSPLHRTICEQLRAAILGRQYQHGDKLPSEAMLCEQFHASRITVAKALQTLQMDGLIVRRAGSGTYIHLHTPNASNPFGLIIPDICSTKLIYH